MEVWLFESLLNIEKSLAKLLAKQKERGQELARSATKVIMPQTPQTSQQQENPANDSGPQFENSDETD